MKNLLFLSFINLLLVLPAMSQSTIHLAVYDTRTDVLELDLGKMIDPRQLISHILLVNATTGVTKIIPATQASVRRTIITLDRNQIGGFFTQPLKNEPVTAFIPFQPDLTKPETIVLSASIRENIQSNKDIATEAPKGRDDADAYLSGSLVAAEGAKPIYAADLKVERMTTIGTSPYRLGLFFSLKASTSPKADPDQFRGGLKATRTIFTDKGDKQCKLCFIAWEGTGEIEADREFRVKNLLTTHRFKFVPRNLFLGHNSAIRIPDRPVIRFMPFLGAELGRNLSSPVVRTERGIARIVGGASLELFVPKSPLKRLGFESMSWQNTFTQRWFLKREMAYDKDDNGDLMLVDFGRKPRPYFLSKFNLMISEYFGPTISYEWGEQPPLYKKVTHKVTVGLTYAFKQKVAK